jgi:hypothetical protein
VPFGFFFSKETHRERKKIHEGGKKKHGKTYYNNIYTCLFFYLSVCLIDTRLTTSDDDR